jgi:hypothetical protein
MPHTLAGSSSANPSSQNFSIAMQFTTRAETLVLVGRPPTAEQSQFPGDARTVQHIPGGSPELSGMAPRTDELHPG